MSAAFMERGPLRPTEHHRRLCRRASAREVRRLAPETRAARRDRHVHAPPCPGVRDQRRGNVHAEIATARSRNGEDESNARTNARVHRVAERNITRPHLAHIKETRAPEAEVLRDAGEDQALFDAKHRTPAARRERVIVPANAESVSAELQLKRHARPPRTRVFERRDARASSRRTRVPRKSARGDHVVPFAAGATALDAGLESNERSWVPCASVQRRRDEPSVWWPGLQLAAEQPAELYSVRDVLRTLERVESLRLEERESAHTKNGRGDGAARLDEPATEHRIGVGDETGVGDDHAFVGGNDFIAGYRRAREETEVSTADTVYRVHLPASALQVEADRRYVLAAKEWLIP